MTKLKRIKSILRSYNIRFYDFFIVYGSAINKSPRQMTIQDIRDYIKDKLESLG